MIVDISGGGLCVAAIYHILALNGSECLLRRRVAAADWLENLAVTDDPIPKGQMRGIKQPRIVGGAFVTGKWMQSWPEPLAIYAAVVSTVVFVWDIIKWRRHERLRLVGRVSSNMEPMGNAVTPQTKGKKYISLYVDNRGHIPCEITHMVFLIYDNWWKALLRRPFKSAIIFDPMTEWTGKRLPFRLEDGGSYWGLCEQTPELEQWSRDKRLYVGVFHNMSKQPFRVRLPAIEQEKTAQ